MGVFAFIKANVDSSFLFYLKGYTEVGGELPSYLEMVLDKDFTYVTAAKYRKTVVELLRFIKKV